MDPLFDFVWLRFCWFSEATLPENQHNQDVLLLFEAKQSEHCVCFMYLTNLRVAWGDRAFSSGGGACSSSCRAASSTRQAASSTIQHLAAVATCMWTDQIGADSFYYAQVSPCIYIYIYIYVLNPAWNSRAHYLIDSELKNDQT